MIPTVALRSPELVQKVLKVKLPKTINFWRYSDVMIEYKELYGCRRL